MWQKIKAMKEQRGQILADSKAIIAKSQEEKRELTAEDNAKIDELTTRAEQLRAEIERYETVQKLEQNCKPEQRAGRDDIGTENADANQGGNETRDFNHFVRTGEIRTTNTITSATGTGAYVPKIVTGPEGVAKLGNSLKAAFAFYGVPAIPVNGEVVVSVPVINLTEPADTLAGDAAAESLANSADASISITTATHNSGAQWLANGIISSINYDGAESLVPVLRVACERLQEAKFYAGSIMTVGLKAAARETATASVVAFGDLSNLLFDLGAYAVGRTAYLVSMSMLAAMHSMADENGRPINKLTKDATGQYFWDGIPVFPTTALEAIADGKYVAAAINVDACRCAESQSWVQRYDAFPTRPNQTGFDYLQYAGFGIKTGAIKLLKVKAAG